jgi:hypothetical protein
MCTHLCAAGPLILSRHPPVKRRESTTRGPSPKFGVLTTEKRTKETGNAPTNRVEIIAPMSSTFEMVRLGEHQLAMAHSTHQLPRQNRRLKFRALTAEKRAKETGNAPTNRLEFTALLPFNFDIRFVDITINNLLSQIVKPLPSLPVGQNRQTSKPGPLASHQSCAEEQLRASGAFPALPGGVRSELSASAAGAFAAWGAQRASLG